MVINHNNDDRLPIILSKDIRLGYENLLNFNFYLHFIVTNIDNIANLTELDLP